MRWSLPMISNRGNVVVLIAVVIIPLILVISLAIDSAVLSSSHTAFQRRANAMALAALEKFQKRLREEPTSTYTQLVEDAMQRAAEIGSLSGNKLVGEQGQELYTQESLYDPNTGLGRDEIGTIEFGRWWHEEPAVTCAAWTSEFATGGSREGESINPSCPCPGGAWDLPCFEENTTTVTKLISETSAVRVHLRTRSSNPIRSIMALFTDAAPTLAVSGISSTVPRNGVFLIDMSRSMQLQSHLPRERLSGADVALSSEYSFRLDPAAGGACAGSTNPCPTSSPECPIAGPQPKGVYNILMENARSAAPGPGTPITKHFKSDYQCVSMSYQPAPGMGSVTEDYLVDTYTSSAPGYEYKGPEPLNTVLLGINVALEELKKRAVAGDRVAVIAFDQDSSIPQRTVGPTRPGLQEYDDLVEVTDVENVSASAIQKRLSGFLFPRDNAQTDISGALAQARDLLVGLPNFQIAQNYVVLFSDGLTSCAHASNADHWMETVNGRRVLSADKCVAADPTSAHRWVAGAYSPAATIHGWGLLEATQLISRKPTWGGGGYERFRYPQKGTWEEERWGDDLLVPTYKDLGITFHMFMIGDDVTPGTILARNASSSGCMTAEEQQATPGGGFGPSDDNIEFFTLPWASDWMAFAKMAGATFHHNTDCEAGYASWKLYTDRTCAYYYPPNGDPAPGRPGAGTILPPFDDFMAKRRYLAPNSHFFLFGTHPTGGVFAPIRKPCNDAAIDPTLSQESCAGGSLMTALDAACAASNYSSVSKYLTTWVSGTWVEKRQLLLCDPTCRSQKQQMEEYMKNIFEDNPYIVVE